MMVKNRWEWKMQQKFKLDGKIKDYILELSSDCYQGSMLILENLLKKLNLSCFDADFKNKDISGVIMQKTGEENFSIYVNRIHSLNRRRFTIAHEIGHYISYQKGSYSAQDLTANRRHEDFSLVFLRNGKDFDRNAEEEANEIAAELLMPERFLQKMVDKKYSIDQMCDGFFVSSAAVVMRITNLYGDRALFT